MKMATLIESNAIPIIDMGIKNVETDFEKFRIKDFAEKLDKALVTDGICLLINHGLNVERLNQVAEHFKEFCQLAPDVRTKYQCKLIHGYIPPGVESFNRSCKEQRHTFNVGNTMHETLPDVEVAGFRDSLLTIINDYNQLQRIFLQAFAHNFGVDEDRLIKTHRFIDDVDFMGSTLRLLNYPASPMGTTIPNTTRCGPHADYGTFTILWQDSEGGLEIEKLDEAMPGVWHPVGHMPNALIVMVGEIMEVWSEKRYRAIVHRVSFPNNAAVRNQDRNALIWFGVPSPEVAVGPLNDVLALTPETKSKFPNTRDLYRQKLLNIIEEGYIEV